jgi:hypothetical protein
MSWHGRVQIRGNLSRRDSEIRFEQDPQVLVPADLGELHHINLPGEPRQSVSPGIVKVEIMDQELIARLAKECIEAGATYSPGETYFKWAQKAYRALAERDFTRASGEVFCFMRDTRNASVEVYPRGSEGEDLAGSHASPQADEEGERYFVTFRHWDRSTSEAEVTKYEFDLYRINPTYARGVVAWRTEPAKGGVPAPLPLVPSDGEDVGEQVDVTLDAAPTYHLKAGITPLGQGATVYVYQGKTHDGREVTYQSSQPLHLECPTALLGTDLIPVPLKSFSERLTGYRPTLHSQNLGLSRSRPEGRGGFSLEGARLANSVPRDLDLPPVLDPSDVRHRRNVARNLDGVKSGTTGREAEIKGASGWVLYDYTGGNRAQY